MGRWKVSKFLAHVVLRPNDGGAIYTVETEFQAVGYPQAFEHIQKLGRTFDGVIVSHRLHMTEQGSAGGDHEVMRFGVHGGAQSADAKPPLMLPPPKEEDKAAALTVNSSRPEWCGMVKPGVPVPKPFPIEEKVA